MEIKKDIEGNTLKLAVSGRIDTVTASQFQGAAVPLPAGVASLDIDLAGVEYVSSAGLRAFAVLSIAVREAGGKLSVRNMQNEVKTVFDMTGFSSMLGLT